MPDQDPAARILASTGFVPEATIRTRISPAPGEGVGTFWSSSTSGPPKRVATIACMVARWPTRLAASVAEPTTLGGAEEAQGAPGDLPGAAQRRVPVRRRPCDRGVPRRAGR